MSRCGRYPPPPQQSSDTSDRLTFAGASVVRALRLIDVFPHAREQIMALAEHCALVTLDPVQGWNVQQWTLTDDDVGRAVAAYQALLAVDLDDELDQLLADMGVDRYGPPATLVQHERVMRADAVELMAAATVISFDEADIDDLHMPNVPKMSVHKSDSGIDVIGIEMDASAAGPIVDSERLILVSVKHTVDRYAAALRGQLEKSVTEEWPALYLHRQLTTLHGRMRQSGVSADTARRIFYFLRETLRHPRVRVVCVGAAAPPPDCNLPDQPVQLGDAAMPDAHFRMLLVPDVASLHEKLVPGG